MKKHLSTKSVYLHKTKSDCYIKDKIRAKYEEADKSIKILLKKINFKNKKILDVGCATGGMYNILRSKFGLVDYTGVDVDARCIKIAKARYPKAKFFSTDIFDSKLKENFYDIVMLWGWSHMYPNWKELYSKLIKLSKKYIMFDNRIKLSGTTITDLDLSYQYYYKSKKRNYYIIHNLYELISFLQISPLNIKNIYSYGYHMPGKTSAKLPISKSEVLIGSFLLEKYSAKTKVNRYGLLPESLLKNWTKLNIKVPGYNE